MDNEKPENEQKQASSKSQYFWDFRGRDFIKRPNSEVYEPITYRPNDERKPDPPVPAIRLKRDFLEWASIVAGWAISLGTLLILALYTYYTRGQWHELIKATNASTQASQIAACALDENKRQFQDTLQQMRGQTKAQQEAADISKEAMITVQRAFVSFLGNISAKKEITDNAITGLTLTLPFQNVGSTSTAHAKGRVNWKSFDPNGMPKDFNFPDQGDVATSQFYIPRGASGNGTMTIPIGFIGLTKVKQARMYVWGWFAYNDVFKGTPRHLTEFCDEITNLKTTKDDVSDTSTDFSWELSLCGVHNCYDTECVDYEAQTQK